MPKGARKGKSEEKIKSHINTPEQYEYYLNTNCNDENSLFYVPSKLYTKIIKEINDEIIKCLLNGDEIKLPYKTGRLSIKKYKQKIHKDKDGNINLSNFPINWDATLKLWEEEPELKKKKHLVRYMNKNLEVYEFVYTRAYANYKNKTACRFRPTRTNKLKLKNAIKNNTIEVFNLF